MIQPTSIVMNENTHVSQFVFLYFRTSVEHNLFPIHLAAIYLLWYLMLSDDPTLIQLHRNGRSHSSKRQKWHKNLKTYSVHKSDLFEFQNPALCGNWDQL